MIRPYYLLDTNVISEITKPFPNENVCKKIEEYQNLCAISSTTWSELIFGMNLMQAGKKKDLIFSDLVDDIQARFEIINYDNHCAWIQADIRSRLQEKGNSLEFEDIQIASIAVSNNMILVTRNVKHFEPIQQVSPLMVENWFGQNSGNI